MRKLLLLNALLIFLFNWAYANPICTVSFYVIDGKTGLKHYITTPCVDKIQIPITVGSSTKPDLMGDFVKAYQSNTRVKLTFVPGVRGGLTIINVKTGITVFSRTLLFNTVTKTYDCPAGQALELTAKSIANYMKDPSDVNTADVSRRLFGGSGFSISTSSDVTNIPSGPNLPGGPTIPGGPIIPGTTM